MRLNAALAVYANAALSLSGIGINGQRIVGNGRCGPCHTGYAGIGFQTEKRHDPGIGGLGLRRITACREKKCRGKVFDRLADIHGVCDYRLMIWLLSLRPRHSTVQL